MVSFPVFKRFLLLAACAAPALLVACSPSSLGNKARGNWQGTVTETAPDGSTLTYPITIIVEDDEHIITDYPSYGCTSTLVRLPSYDGFNEYIEKIREGGCGDGGLVTLVLQEEGAHPELEWRWKMRAEQEKLTTATATLQRVPPSEPKDVAYFREQAAKESQ